MLSARKIHLAAGLKVQGLGLRQAELDFHMSRMIAISAISSIETGLSYVGIIKIKIPETMVVDFQFTQWQVFAYYVCSSLTLAFALLNLLISGFLVVGAQGLTLRGPPNSVARCVTILSDFWPFVRFNLILSIFCLLGASATICWMKLSVLPGYPYTAIGCTAIFVVGLLGASHKIRTMWRELRIPSDGLVRGDLSVAASGVQPLQAGPGPGGGGSLQEGGVNLISEDYAVIPVAQR